MNELVQFIETRPIIAGVCFFVASVGIVGTPVLLGIWASKPTRTVLRPSDFGEEGEQ
jgi:hypothetical protein